MNILFLNTSEEFGGAAIAAKRLMTALNKNHINTTMLVRDKTSKDSNVVAIHQGKSIAYKFIKERLVIWKSNLFSRKNLFAVSIANTGSDITQFPEFVNADIIHIHWINQGFISMKGLERIINSGKPIVWTMHDMWPITGICHHARGCEKYMTQCVNCPFLVRHKNKDLAFSLFKQKKALYKKANITFVGCSLWLTDLASHSALTTRKTVLSIPNPINTDIYQPLDKKMVRDKLNLPLDKKLILFGAAKSTDERKGVSYFVDACKLLHKEIKEHIGVVLYGKESEKLVGKFDYPTYVMGYISDEKKLIELYSAVDIFAIPSLEENLPNSIIESMACGTPSIGFNIGGIPEIIDHIHNGYVANYKSAKDFSKGLKWILENNENNELGLQARRKVIDSYSEREIAQQYITLYNSLIE